MEEVKKPTIRIVGVFTHPIQYFIPLFRALSSCEDIEFEAIFLDRMGIEKYFDPGFKRELKWDIDLTEGYRYSFTKNWGHHRLPLFFRYFNPGIARLLITKKYDVIFVHGYDHISKWLVFLIAKATRTPFLLHGESNLIDPITKYKNIIKKIILKPLVRAACALPYIGTANREFYVEYGAPEVKLFPCPYSVDNAFFQRSDAERARLSTEFRKRYGIGSDEVVFIFVGKFIGVKNPLFLLDAFRRVSKAGSCKLLLVGDGDLRPEMEEEIKRDGTDNVIFTGFLNQTEIIAAYAAGDVLVLPSIHEPWGLVVNEAMNLHTAIIVSDRVGCAKDLVRSGVNGEVFRHDISNELTEAMIKMIEKRKLLEEYKRRSFEIICGWRINDSAKGIVEAAKYCIRTEMI